ncbi:ceramide kinase-like protein [Asterias rubens]|uniref:ceramide kinase-like protein n=1 Tax=Asterias rubens TaxID=7604 RepID=UPI0014550A27|nr:ceramide kinase-like protein [Asterias rubens]
MAKAAWTSNRAVPTMALKDFPSSQKRKVAFRLDHQEEEHPGPTTPLKLPLRGIFDIGSKHYDVTLEKDRISWSLIQPARHDGQIGSRGASVSMHDVYAVKIKRVQKPGKNRGYPKGVTLSVATPCKKDPNILTEDCVTLRSTNEENCQTWCSAIDSVLKGFPERPRRLRVFVNGWLNDGAATRVFYSKVVPVFQAAGTRLDVIVTSREGSAHQILQTVDLDSYDGVVCVGGEDTVNEVVHGLLERTQVDSDLVDIDPDTKLTKCDIPLGIVPVGMFNTVAHSSQGTSDAFTAALNIVLGHRHPLDVSAIFHNRAFIRFGFSLMYGFGGDCLRRAERRRTKGVVGSRAAEYATVRSVFKLRPYRCSVEYLPSESSLVITDRLPCRTGCATCKTEHPKDRTQGEDPPGEPGAKDGTSEVPEVGGGGGTGHGRNGRANGKCVRVVEGSSEEQPDRGTTDSHIPDGEWISLTGNFLSISALTLPNLCSWCPRGLSPLTHLADGRLDLVLVRDTARGEFVQHLRRHATTKDQFDFPFVSVHCARAVRILPLGWDDKPCTSLTEDSQSDVGDFNSEEASLKTDIGGAVTATTKKEFSMWNVDMELMAPVAMEMRVHNQLLTLFASGIQEAEPAHVSCGCL